MTQQPETSSNMPLAQSKRLLRDTTTIAGGLALSTLAAVILAPPEAYGSVRMFLVFGVTFAFLILTLEGAVPRRYLWLGVGGAMLLLAHSLWFSLDPYRSLQFLPILWAYYCVFGFFAYSPKSLERWVLVTLVLLAASVSIYGLHQYFWGLGEMYNFVLYSGSNEVIRVPALERLASERIFSTFALPGTLWGFLLLSLPLHAAMWIGLPHLLRAKWARTLARIGLVASAGLLLAATLLTSSYGIVAGLFVLLAGWFWMHSRSRAWKPALWITLPLLVVAGAIYSARAGTYNPVSLRLMNWLSGWEIFAAHPLGAGLDAYAVLYFQHRQFGANETQYAHNTPVQLLAELGIFGLAAAAIAIYYIWKHWTISPRPHTSVAVPSGEDDLSRTRPYLWLAFAVWGMHNLIDINLYFASIGTIGAALAALLARPFVGRSTGQASHDRPRPWIVRATGLTAGAVVVASGFIYVSGELLHRARIELGDLKNEEAAATLADAAAINPFDSSIFHEAGQVNLELYHKTHHPVLLAQSIAYFTRAIELSPLKVGPHVGLALGLSTMDRTEEALRELEIAQSLHPQARQASVIRRLIERRQAELSAAAGTAERLRR